MFGRIAHRYDLMNRLMSLGMDQGWRRAVADAARLPADGRALDVGTGTGRLALALAERLGPRGRVAAADFAEPMVRAGRPVVRAHPAGYRVQLLVADALRLPFAGERFDTVTSAFVVRNLADVEAGLHEQARVLRSGGRVVVLEITPGPPGLLRPLFRVYFRQLVPLVGGLVAGDRAAYTYLPESAAHFLEPERLAGALQAAGFTEVSVRRLAFGSVAITAGTKR